MSTMTETVRKMLSLMRPSQEEYTNTGDPAIAAMATSNLILCEMIEMLTEAVEELEK